MGAAPNIPPKPNRPGPSQVSGFGGESRRHRSEHAVGAAKTAEGSWDRQATVLLAASQHPPRAEYVLTEKGQALEPVLIALKKWGEMY